MVKQVEMPSGDWGNDAADWQGTSEEWREKMGQAEREAEAKAAGRYRLMTPEELSATPASPYRVKDVLPASGVVAVYGAPKSGKTFVVLDLIGAVTEGREWFGHRTRPCHCVYVGLEGQAGLAQRWTAYSRIKGQARQAELRFMTMGLSLLETGELGELASAVRAAGCADGVVVIDTLNAASVGADENSSADMGKIIAGAKHLQAEVGGLVLLVHHAGKDASRGMRGHSSLLGAVDAVLEVTRDESGRRREWRVERSKDAPESDPIPFGLSVVELGEDEDGDPVTSCVVEPREHDDTRHVKRRPPGGNQKLALRAIELALKESGEYGQGGAPEFRPCITYDRAMEVTTAKLPVEKDRQRERARLAIQGLVSAGHLSFGEEWLWLP